MTRQEHIDAARKVQQIEDAKRKKEYDRKIEEDFRKMLERLEDKKEVTKC